MRRRNTVILPELAAALTFGGNACALLLQIDKTYTEGADAADAGLDAAGRFCDRVDADNQAWVSPPGSVTMALASTTSPFADLTEEISVTAVRYVANVVVEAQ